MGMFVRLTVLIALGIVALMVLAFLLKAIFLAAVVAALVIAGVFAVNAIRRASGSGSGPLVPR